MSKETFLRGWILDIYPLSDGNAALWVIGEDGNRRRLSLHIPVTFYAAGSHGQLVQLERILADQSEPFQCYHTKRKDVYKYDGLLDVLAIVAEGPESMSRLFTWANNRCPYLIYYDVDLSLPLRLSAAYDIYPLCLTNFSIDGDDIISIQALESRWTIEQTLPPLRILDLSLDHNPTRILPTHINVKWDKYNVRVPVKPERAMCINLGSIINKFNPDLIVSDWGDGYLLPFLIEAAEHCNHPIHFNRDFDFLKTRTIADRSFFSYGQIIHKDKQTLLYGRIHIDRRNAMMFSDYGMEGIFEMARVTCQSIQTAARVSPGTGISSMQIITALKNNILVPWHTKQPEIRRSMRSLMEGDRGGVILETVPGIYKNAGSVDFSGLFPSIMLANNLSPETRRKDGTFDKDAPLGIIPLTLKPMLEKRLAIKKELEKLNKADFRKKKYKAWSSAMKWLGVVASGYENFSLSKFGCIESFEAINLNGREAILKAKMVAEDEGFRVLAIYIDSLTLQKEGADSESDYRLLLDKIEKETGLPIAFEGLYCWVVYLSSKVNGITPVPNRYFGLLKPGGSSQSSSGYEIKMRGIEARRRDSPPWIVEFQTRLIEYFAKEPNPDLLINLIPGAIALIRSEINLLNDNKVPIGQLVINHRLSRNLEDFRVATAAVRAGKLLTETGRVYKAGMTIQYVYVLGYPGVIPVDLITPDSPTIYIDKDKYLTLLLRASHTVLEAMGMSYEMLFDRAVNKSVQLPLEFFPQC